MYGSILSVQWIYVFMLILLSSINYCSYTVFLEKAMAPHSSAFAWKIPGMEEPGRLQSMGSLSQTRLSNFPFTFHLHALEKEMATHSNVLAWRISGMGEPGGLPSMGSYRVGHDWSDLVAAAAVVFAIHWHESAMGVHAFKKIHKGHLWVCFGLFTASMNCRYQRIHSRGL